MLDRQLESSEAELPLLGLVVEGVCRPFPCPHSTLFLRAVALRRTRSRAVRQTIKPTAPQTRLQLPLRSDRRHSAHAVAVAAEGSRGPQCPRRKHPGKPNAPKQAKRHHHAWVRALSVQPVYMNLGPKPKQHHPPHRINRRVGWELLQPWAD